MTSASEALRNATARAHGELEATEVAHRLREGSIAREAYADYLRAVAVLVASLRTAIRRHGPTDLAHLLPTLEDWAERLAVDIRALAGDDPTANEGAQTAVLQFMQKAYGELGHGSEWLYGVLYVLHGSHNGNRQVAQAIRRGLDLGGGPGTSYLGATEGEPAAWRSFKALLDERLTSEEQHRSAAAGAAEAFECFRQVFHALEDPGGRRVRASAINPEAGDHPVPDDPRLARVAAEVGRAAHLAFGYLVRRYGGRGEAFARSDGVWMVTLLDMPEDRAQGRVDWLARLLSSRGVPSLCLEHHLEQLHHALWEAGALGGRGSSRLLALSRHVGAARRAAIPEEQWASIVDTPVPALDPLGAATLVSAVVDQQSGLAKCADSMARWIETESSLERREREELLAILQLPRGH